MSNAHSRRLFLARSAQFLAGAGAASMVWPRAAAAEEQPRWCLACRDALLQHTGQPDCWSALRTIGAEGAEVTINEDLALPVLFHPEKKYSAATEADIERLRADLQAAGRRITAFCMYNRFEDRPDFEIEWGAKVAKVAQALGAKAIRIDVVPHKLPAGEFLDFAAATLKKLIQQLSDLNWEILTLQSE